MARTADYPIHDLFLRRWSPRAMSGEPMKEADLMRLFEAARWAPSSGNFQPWRFLYARAGTAHFEKFFDLLNERNRKWCVRAGALVVVVSKTTFEANGVNKPSPTHSFDTGAAWMSLALEASLDGLVAHGMAGFNWDRARTELNVPDDFAVNAMIALGYPGKIEDLSESDRAREQPSLRKPISEFISEGGFGKL